VISSFLTGGRELVAKSSILILTFPLVFFTLRSKNSAKVIPSRVSSPKAGMVPRSSGASEGRDPEPASLGLARKAKGQLSLNSILTPWIVFLGVMLVSGVFSVARYDSFLGALYWIAYAIIFWVVVQWINSYKRALHFTFFTVSLGVLLSIVGIYFFVVSEIFGYLRLSSTFYSHNPFAGFLLFLAPLSVCYFIYFLYQGRQKFIFLWGGVKNTRGKVKMRILDFATSSLPPVKKLEITKRKASKTKTVNS